MLLIILRLVFLLIVIAVGMSYVEPGNLLPENRPYLILGAMVLGGLTIAIDLTIPRKSLQAVAGLFFGLLVGMVITWGLTYVVDLIATTFWRGIGPDNPAISITKILLGVICCYLCVSFIMQTKDDVRFVIPYVEFSKQLKGRQPLLLDTSVIIDGRIVDICETGFVDQQVIVPRFVLNELQAVADSADKLKRNRGRRGLDVLSKLQSNDKLEIEILDAKLPKHEAAEGVDLKLVAVAQQINGKIATNDYNLNKLAKVRGVEVLNINDLANALKPVVLPGEGMMVKIIKAGEEPGQGIGYLDDGTMVVVEQGRARIGDRVSVAVTSVLQTSAGRMIFGRIEGAAPVGGPGGGASGGPGQGGGGDHRGPQNYGNRRNYDGPRRGNGPGPRESHAPPPSSAGSDRPPESAQEG